MSETSQVSIPSLRRKKTLDISTARVLLERIPLPALLVEPGSWKILIANPAAAKLTDIPIDELTQLELFSLLNNWNSDFMELFSGVSPMGMPRSAAPIRVELIRRDKSSVVLKLQLLSFQEIENLSLILLEPEEISLSDTSTQLPQIFHGLSELANVPKLPDIETALRATLETGSAMTEANILAVYKAQEGIPFFQRFVGFGDASLLPEQLTDLELEGLDGTDLWTAANRPLSALHRSGRECGLSFMATHMLGEKNATIGLLVIADQKKSPPEYILESTKVLGSGVTALIQMYSKKFELYTNLEEEQLDNHILRKVINTISEATVIIDPEYRIMQLNSSAENILGYSGREAKGQPVDNILIGEENFSSILVAFLEGSTTYNLENIHLFRRNGDKFLATIRIVPVKDCEDCLAIAIVIQDLSEQEEIRTLAQQYEQRATLGEVTAMFAHEMRNMINNISTTLQLMRRQAPENETQRRHLVQMLEECDRLNEQVSAVLAISKPKKYDMSALNVAQLLGRLLERFNARILKAKVKCDLVILPDCPLVEGNRYALEEVFGNLINNALEAMGETGGRLVLRAQPLDTPEGKSYVQVAVADTGPGIPPEIRDRIFQPFFTTKQTGTGLGLPIIKGIVSAHRGNIKVEYYTPGTVFYIQLPASKKKEETI